MTDESKCPVTGRRSKPIAGGGTSNRDWWPVGRVLARQWPPKARPGPAGRFCACWAIYSTLGGFDYVSSEDVRDELKRASDAMSKKEGAWRCPEKLHTPASTMVRIADVPVYAVDATVRRAAALQTSPLAEAALVRINDAEAKKLGLTDGDLVSVKQEGAQSILTLAVDARVAAGCAWIPAALAGTAALGANGMAVELEPIHE